MNQFRSRWLLSLLLFPLFGANAAPLDTGSRQRVSAVHARLARTLIAKQLEGNHWDGPFEGDSGMDAMLLLLGARLGKLDEELRKQACGRMLASPLRTRDGLWSNYPAGPADYNVTAMNLQGLVVACGIPEDDSRIQAASQWYRKKGGWKGTHPMFQSFLSFADVVPTADVPHLSPKFMALPKSAPVNFFNLGLARTAVVPMAVWSHYRAQRAGGKVVKKIDGARLVSAGALFGRPFAGTLSDVFGLGALPGFDNLADFGPRNPDFSSIDLRHVDRTTLRQVMLLADRVVPGRAEFWAQESIGWLLASQQEDGSWAGTLQSSYMALIALQEASQAGAGDFSQAIQKGWDGLKGWRRKLPSGEVYQQFSEGPVMETARTLTALRLSPGASGLAAAMREPEVVRWLLSKQILKEGDWSARNPKTAPGGWAYQYFNDRYPDVDDTAMVIETLALTGEKDKPEVRQAIERGTGWMLGMQNKDGGFPVWEHETPEWLRSLMGLSIGMDVLVDPSQVDVTSRALMAINRLERTGLSSDRASDAVLRACDFLQRRAQRDGQASVWQGDWAVNYLYGTAQAASALLLTGCWSLDDAKPTILWLLSKQDAGSGGWGESPQSYLDGAYKAAPPTISQTAFVLDALLTYREADSRLESQLPGLDRAIRDGAEFISRKAEAQSFELSEPEFMQVIFKGRLYGRYLTLPHYEAVKVLGRYLSEAVLF